MHEGLRADGDLVAEQGGDLMRVPRTADVAQQRDPVDDFAQARVEAGFLAQRRGEQTRTQLRFERLTEGVVLRQGEGRDEFAQPQRGIRNRETSRC